MLTYRFCKNRNQVGNAISVFSNIGTFVEWINEDNELERGRIAGIRNNYQQVILVLEDGSMWKAPREELMGYAPSIVFYKIEGRTELPTESVLHRFLAEKDQNLLFQLENAVVPVKVKNKPAFVPAPIENKPETKQPKQQRKQIPAKQQEASLDSFASMGAFISRVVKDTELFLLVSSDEV